MGPPGVSTERTADMPALGKRGRAPSSVASPAVAIAEPTAAPPSFPALSSSLSAAAADAGPAAAEAAIPALGKRGRAPSDVASPAVTAAEPTVAPPSFPALSSSSASVAVDAGSVAAEPAAETAQKEDDELLLNSRDHYRLRKRLPLRRESNRCDVYVTRSARFRALQARCVALLDARRSPVLHALGAAIGRACDLALAVQTEARGEVVLAVRTDTVVVYDDYEPLVPDLPSVTKERSKSAVHITMTPTKNYV